LFLLSNDLIAAEICVLYTINGGRRLRIEVIWNFV